MTIDGGGTDVHPPGSKDRCRRDHPSLHGDASQVHRPARQAPTADIDIDATDTATTTEEVAPAVKSRRLCDM